MEYFDFSDYYCLCLLWKYRGPLYNYREKKKKKQSKGEFFIYIYLEYFFVSFLILSTPFAYFYCFFALPK